MSKWSELIGRNDIASDTHIKGVRRYVAEDHSKRDVARSVLKTRVNRRAILSLCLLTAITLWGLVTDDALIGMLVAAAQIAFIFAEAKLSLFSIFPALLTFCLFQEYAAVSGFEVYGVLALGVVPYYFDELKVCVYIFNISAILLVLFTGVVKKERELVRTRFAINDRAAALFILMAVVITLLIFPSLPNFSAFSSGNRFGSGILPFSGWSIVPFFLLSAAIGNTKSRISGAAASIFVIAWYAFHGERVETIGFVVFLAIKYYAINKNRRGTTLKLVAVSAIIIPVFVAIGSLRSGSGTLDVGELLRSVAIQSTACDVTYVFNCAVDLYYRGIQLDGGTYLSYLVNCIPLLEDPYAFATVIERYYFTPGGGLFFAEPIANFGFLFSAAFSFAYLALIAAVINRGGTWSYLVYSALMICVFRSAWYGLNYPITTIVYFVPFAMVVSGLLEIPKGSPLPRDASVNKRGANAMGQDPQAAPITEQANFIEESRYQRKEFVI